MTTKQSLDIMVFPVGSAVWVGSNLSLKVLNATVEAISIWINDRNDLPKVSYICKARDGKPTYELQGLTDENVFATKLEADDYNKVRIQLMRESMGLD